VKEEKIKELRGIHSAKLSIYITLAAVVMGIIFHLLGVFTHWDELEQYRQKVIEHNRPYENTIKSFIELTFIQFFVLWLVNIGVAKVAKIATNSYYQYKLKIERWLDEEMALNIVFLFIYILVVPYEVVYLDEQLFLTHPMLISFWDNVYATIVSTLDSHDYSMITPILVIAVIIVIYLTPTFIAYKRKHHNRLAILFLNILLGWSILGWVIAAIWSGTAVMGNGLTKSSIG